jgi:hypothetical protein
MVIAHPEATVRLSAPRTASSRICGTDRPEPFPEPLRSAFVLTEEEFVTYLLLQGLFVRHDGRDLGTG